MNKDVCLYNAAYDQEALYIVSSQICWAGKMTKLVTPKLEGVHTNCVEGKACDKGVILKRTINGHIYSFWSRAPTRQEQRHSAISPSWQSELLLRGPSLLIISQPFN